MARASILRSSIRYTITPGSSAPQRVPIGSPSAGVKLIVVAMLRPASMAHMLDPLPRCSTIALAVFASKRGGNVLVGQAVEAVTLHAGVVELGRQRESLRDGRIRPMERRVEARDLREFWRALEQQGDGRQVVRLVQGRERDEALERLERLGQDPHGSGVCQTPVHDPVAYADQPVVRELVLQEVSEILHRIIVTEFRS